MTEPDSEMLDLLDLLLSADPYAAYARLREERPVSRARYLDGAPVWLVTRYADVKAALTDPRLAHDLASHGIRRGISSGLPADIAPYFTRSMLDRDPPEHTRLRGLVSRAFTARRVHQLRPRIRRLAGDLVDRLATRPEAELIEDLAYPLPISVICELLGVAPADHDRWRVWAGDLFGVTPGRLASSARELLDHVLGLIRDRRDHPTADLVSDLVHVHDGTDRLDEPELASMVIGLLAAGHETTVQLIGNGLYALLTRPDQLALARTDPARLPRAVDELLRYLGPAEIAGTRRVATEDIEVGGVRIRAGELVLPVLGAANHDPRRFTEPERLDITRTDNQHLGFGHGIHFCLGAALARAEAEIAIGTLLRRFPRLRLAVPADQLRWRTSGVRGLARLPVALGAG